ncbi:MAG: DNA polymerase III subunit gamma/tau [Gammaproteobacteria bacterium]
MSYQVLARKWRPHCFEDMVGQRHVLQALTNALDSDRLHHAYLFSGTRGVGKTTIARIFAKSLNCENGVSAKPCGQCSSCTEIDEGRFVDLIEVDAASRTGVDDTRDLLDNVQYSPTRGRYKVYLIDEVHMFSKSSFNALLKTLEEPPPHVKFLLATTDPKKIPATILSRCLQFNLKRITPDQIEKQLKHILEEEKINFDDRSLEMISFAADGSLRDSLSLLDQAISFCSGELKADEVAGMLGTIDKDQVLNLLELLASKDAAAVLSKTEQLAELGPDYQVILAELLIQLQAIAVRQLVPEARRDHRDSERLDQIAALLTVEECQLFYQIALIGQRDLPFHPDPESGFEMILLRMLAFQKMDVGSNLDSVKKKALDSSSHKTEILSASHQDSDLAVASQTSDSISPSETESEIEHFSEWDKLIDQLSLKGLAHQLAINCTMESFENNEFHLVVAPGSMRTRRMEQQIHEALRTKFDQDLKLIITEKVLEDRETPRAMQERKDDQRLDQAKQVIKSDPDIQALCDAFDATIIEDSIRPVDGEK